MGGGSKKVTVGYRYLMGVQLAVCHGPVDSVNKIVIGERLAWTGPVSSSTSIYVNNPQLFGGDSREGGVKGYVDVMMGDAAQGRNAYLAKHQGANCPGYRGLLSMVFKSFLWSSGNPYFKSPWVEVTRVLKGWQNDTPWNPTYALINGVDMNPAHIIYQCLTDPAWGMGYNASDIGDSFYSAATALHTEKFGLSLAWDQQSSIEDFVQLILTHINGTLNLDMSTGKLELDLIRDDYDMGDLTVFNETNVLQLKSFQRAAFGESANEVVVTYTDREGNDKTVAVQDIASIAAQGGVISTTKQYPGIRDGALAARVAMRDLATLSSPLAQATIVTNRSAWDKKIGDVVNFVWPSLGINGVAFRIINIDKGNLTSGEITITMVEDVFGLPDANYTSAPPTQWVDTVIPPVAVDASRPFEAPYWEISRRMSLADRAYLQPGYGFGMFLAGRGAVQSMLGYVLSASSDNVTFDDVGDGNFSPYGSLVSNVDWLQESITLTTAYDLSAALLDTDGGYLIIGNECMSVTSVNQVSGVVEVRRGVLDTVPLRHSAGARVFFMTQAAGYDPTERVSGETVHYRPRPSTGLGTLDVNDAETETLVLANRASRPYPPGNFKIGGEYFPTYIPGPNVEVTWAHRDRAAQTVSLIDFKTGNIGPEPGTTYRLRLYSGNTLLHTYDLDGTTTSWSYPTDHDNADGNLAVLRVTLHSVRDGLESLYGQEHAFQRNITSGGYIIDTPPAAPILSATPGVFNIYVSWLYGDARTNVEYVELRVADVPDITKSTVLVTATYPDQDFTHDLNSVDSFRWYWARTADTSGNLSPWSNMVSARPLAADPRTMLNEINQLLTDGSGSAKIELIADRFSIVAPDGSKTPFAVVEQSPGQWATLLNSDVLIGGDVNIANLSSGALPNDVIMRLGGGVIELDGEGQIRVFKDLNPNADFVQLSSGEIRFLRYINGVYQTYNYLSRLETGQANSGQTVTIPGYWKAQPRVMVSPAALTLYKTAYANQDQAINCQALNIQEVVPGSGVYQFDAIATLTLAAATGGSAINAGSGDQSGNTYTSPTQTTPANCLQITPTVQVRSNRGNGASQYFRRTVKWRIEYLNGGNWVLGAWRTVNLGEQLSAVTDSQSLTFPSAGVWQWRISYESLDTDGSVFGAISYSYSQTTVNMVTNDSVSGTPVHRDSVTTSGTWPYYWAEKNSNIPFSTATGSGEIYEVVYSATVDLVFANSFTYASNGGIRAKSYAHIDGMRSGGARGYYSTEWSWSGLTGVADVQLLHPNYSDGVDRIITKTVSGSNLPSSLIDFTYKLYVEPNGDGGGITVNFKTGSAVIKRRVPLPNSTTPSNNFLLSSYTFNLTTAQVLATGTLNWQAIGE